MLIREEKGITLIEMLVSIAIVSILSVSFYQILSTFSKNFEIQDAIAEMQQQGRFTADLISREIRQTGYDPTGGFFNHDPPLRAGKPYNNCDDIDVPVERILEASQTVFHYIADLNKNGTLYNLSDPKDRDPNEHVRYEWVGSLGDESGDGKNICGKNRKENTLYRQSNSVNMQPVSSDIVALNFQYFDDSNMVIPVPMSSAQRAQIWKVVLTLIARTDRPDSDYPENNGYRTRTFVYDIWLRNT